MGSMILWFQKVCGSKTVEDKELEQDSEKALRMMCSTPFLRLFSAVSGKK
mgnify:CR=1 FL=1